MWMHPAKNSRGRVLLIHGISEHSGRHANTINCLVENGYSVVRFDLRGMGQSGGRRQWIERFEDYVEDAADVLNWIQRTHPDLPTFVMGHSLGGLIATHFAPRYQRLLKGLILSAPAFRVGISLPALTLLMGQAFAKVAPSFPLPKAKIGEGISRDPAVVEAYKIDPLCCHYNTLQQGREILQAMESVPALGQELQIPVFIAHGSLDRVIALSGSFEMIRDCKAPDKTMYILPGGFHELHNDLDKDLYFQYVIEWLKKH